MANIKYTINATEEQLNKLYDAFNKGCPVDVALKFSGIAKATYYYWVAIASIVKYVKEQEFLTEQENEIKSGVDVAVIRDSINADNDENNEYKGTVDAFVQPTHESLLKYKNNKRFHDYADKVYEIISKCDELRSEVILYHLESIRKASRIKGINATSSQWFLERTMPGYFGKKDDNAVATTSTKDVQPVTVKFIDPKGRDSTERIKAMEQQILNDSNPKDVA